MFYETEIPVTGMTCSACAAHVEKAVSGLLGVGSVNVNLLAGAMTAEYDRTVIDAEEIIRAVEQAG